MEKSTIDNLCRTIRAAGLPKDRANHLLNTICKWVQGSGVEWTVDRLKTLHDWYISRLAGTPNIPAWVAHKGDVPKGAFRCVFLMRNTQCALALVSLHTAFLHQTPSPKQWKKLEDSMRSDEVRSVPWIRFTPTSLKPPKRVPNLEYTSPTFTCLTGVSIPVADKRVHLNPGVTRGEVANAYAQSWLTLPEVTLDFLMESMERRSHAPPMIGGQLTPSLVVGRITTRDSEEYKALLMGKRPHEEDKLGQSLVGHLSCIQEASLKARWIGNPNRITQHFLRPLEREWKKWLRCLPTDCTDSQESGILWAQSMLAEGKTLVGADLSSASDKLSLWPCLDLCHVAFCGTPVNKDSTVTRALWKDAHGMAYLQAVDHFAAVSRGEWLAPDGRHLSWNAGWCLGTAPSFPLLGMTNNLVALRAAEKVSLPWQNSFRVIGDDIVMREELFSPYAEMITSLGGVVNLDKTRKSDKAVEFAGRVITPKTAWLKRVKSHEVSDDSFMALMSMMGEQAKAILRPRQRRVWDEFRFVPGIAVPGPYSPRSYGERLLDRYQWYLEQVQSERIKPDGVPTSPQQWGLGVHYSILEERTRVDASYVIPADILEGRYNPLKTAYQSPTSGDPRRLNGKSLLESFEALLKQGDFIGYQDYKRKHLDTNQVGNQVNLTSNPGPTPAVSPPTEVRRTGSRKR